MIYHHRDLCTFIRHSCLSVNYDADVGVCMCMCDRPSRPTIINIVRIVISSINKKTLLSQLIPALRTWSVTSKCNAYYFDLFIHFQNYDRIIISNCTFGQDGCMCLLYEQLDLVKKMWILPHNSCSPDQWISPSRMGRAILGGLNPLEANRFLS